MFDRKSKKSTTPSPSASRQVLGGRPPEGTTPAAPTATASPAALRPTSVSPASSGAESSTLNKHVSIEGSLKFTGTVVVNGSVRGSIETSDRLIVGPTADIQAHVVAGSVEVSGRIEGNILAKSSVRIRNGGKVIGDIETPTISMEEGVVFEGRCTRPAESTEESEPAAAPQTGPHGSEPAPGSVRPTTPELASDHNPLRPRAPQNQA